MAEEKSWFDTLVEGAGKLGSTASDIIGGFTDDDDSEKAYLQGQIAGITSEQNRQEAAGTIKIGDVEISTSSILWIVGGTLGLLTIGLGIKKLM